MAEDLERLVQAAHEPDGAQDVLVDRDLGRGLGPGGRLRVGGLGLERAALGGLPDRSDVDDFVLDLEAVLEATQLRDTLMERRLAALEPRRDRAAGARLLALRPAARGLALAGRDAATDACALLA